LKVFGAKSADAFAVGFRFRDERLLAGELCFPMEASRQGILVLLAFFDRLDVFLLGTRYLAVTLARAPGSQHKGRTSDEHGK
jgi:hypothetical protein